MNKFAYFTWTKSYSESGSRYIQMAEFRPNSEIIGKIRKKGKFYGHFVKLQKWLL